MFFFANDNSSSAVLLGAGDKMQSYASREQVLSKSREPVVAAKRTMWCVIVDSLTAVGQIPLVYDVTK